MEVEGQIIDILRKKIFPGVIVIKDGVITDIVEKKKAPNRFIMPGFIDSHVHIESSMVVPSRFAEMAVANGTIGVVSDPHEIANVLGEEGVLYMINDGKKVPFNFCFGAPSCVPATMFDYSGAVINSDGIEKLLKKDDIGFLSEMMNFPGVINNDIEVIKKIQIAKKYSKPIDGHAPGLTGKDLKRYIEKGISTDHEAFSLSEAREKIKKGMKIQIREGSAAKNFENLFPLIDEFPGKIMFCTDDCHPHDLIEGPIKNIVIEALRKGCNLFNVLLAACITPCLHYKLNIGLLQKNDIADFIIVDDLQTMDVIETWINGKKVFFDGSFKWKRPKIISKNKFLSRKIEKNDIVVNAKKGKSFINAIQVIDGELITKFFKCKPNIVNGKIEGNIDEDILKIVVVNRYVNSKPTVGFVKGFGFKYGAMAESIAHDSHNIIAVGTNDDDIIEVINNLMEIKGGIVVKNINNVFKLPLPVAGLMSMDTVTQVGEKYRKLDKIVHCSGCNLKAPFMTLAFMSLLVIPELKIGDKGLFDVNKFQYIPLFL